MSRAQVDSRGCGGGAVGGRLAVDRAARLLDVYGGLLSVRQRAVAALVYEDDWTLAEVAALHGVSRAAAADVLGRAGRQLEAWDAVLGLVKHREAAAALVADLRRAAADIAEGPVRGRVEALTAALAELEGVGADV